jgi:hypothetical protein
MIFARRQEKEVSTCFDFEREKVVASLVRATHNVSTLSALVWNKPGASFFARMITPQ